MTFLRHISITILIVIFGLVLFKTFSKSRNGSIKDLQNNFNSTIFSKKKFSTNNKLQTKDSTLHSKYSSRKQVLIVTEYRSGSSFIGEIFNRNPDIFYLFEPLLLTTIYGKQKQRTHTLLQTKLLVDYFAKCELPNPEIYLTDDHYTGWF